MEKKVLLGELGINIISTYENYSPVLTHEGVLRFCLPESLVMNPSEHRDFIRDIEELSYKFLKEVYDIKLGVLALFEKI